MMKRYFLFAFWLLLPAAGADARKQGQALIDSLSVALSMAQEDTNKAKILIELSDKYSGISPDTGIIFGQKGMLLAERLGWKNGAAAANYFVGFNYYNKSYYPEALEFLFKSLSQSEAIYDEPGMANASRKIGNVYRDQKNYAKAAYYLFKALKLFEKNNDKIGLGRVFSNIGELYAFDGQYNMALAYYDKALKVNEETGYTNGTIITYYRKAIIHVNMKNYSAALASNLKAVAVVEKNRSTVPKEQIAEALGLTGISYLYIARDSADNNTSYKEAALHKAIYYLNQAITVAREIGQLTDLELYYSHLSEANHLSGDYPDAYAHLRQAYQLRDTLHSARNNSRIRDIESRREQMLKAQLEKLEAVAKRNEALAIIAGFAALLCITGIVFRNYRHQQKANAMITKEKRKSDQLLLNILPAEVAEELKETGNAQARQFEAVSVLFTDFVSFTRIAEQLSPQVLVKELHECFTAFDAIVYRNGLEKIKTIGDAYMAVSGLPVSDPRHAIKAVKAAMEIRDFIEERKKRENAFEIRIGIDSGPVVAGIVGVKKFAYDIWGDTVNTANRMEQHGEPGRINISQSTHELVKDDFLCACRGKIAAKNKGEIEMYFVEAALVQPA